MSCCCATTHGWISAPTRAGALSSSRGQHARSCRRVASSAWGLSPSLGVLLSAVTDVTDVTDCWERRHSKRRQSVPGTHGRKRPSVVHTAPTRLRPHHSKLDLRNACHVTSELGVCVLERLHQTKVPHTGSEGHGPAPTQFDCLARAIGSDTRATASHGQSVKRVDPVSSFGQVYTNRSVG